MINIGNKEITSIYCGKNAVNGIYVGSKLIWPGDLSKRYLLQFYSQDENATYDLYNPKGGTYDNEYFQELYEISPLDNRIYLNKVASEYDDFSGQIKKWEYSAFTRHISDTIVKVIVPTIMFGEVEDVGECWYRCEISKIFDNQASADDYVNEIHQNGIADFEGFEMSNNKDVILGEGNEPYTEFPFKRCVWPPTDPSVDTYNWISEVYDQLPRYHEPKVKDYKYMVGTITDSQGQEFSTIFEETFPPDDYLTQYTMKYLNGVEVSQSSPLYASIQWMNDGRKWRLNFSGGTVYVDADRNDTKLNFTVSQGGMSIQYDLTRTYELPEE